MPRTMRVEYPGAIYHVMDRGDRREDIFVDDVDRQDFLKTLAEACRKTDWPGARLLPDAQPFSSGNPRSAQYERARKSKFLSVAARRLGAHYFFRKPVDAQALIDAIQWVLDPEVQCAAEPQHQR
jgi:hypothetical protein